MGYETSVLKNRVEELERKISSLTKRLEQVDASCSAKVADLDSNVKNYSLKTSQAPQIADGTKNAALIKTIEKVNKSYKEEN